MKNKILLLLSFLFYGCISEASGEVSPLVTGPSSRRDEQGASPGKGGAAFRTVGADSYAADGGATMELGFPDGALVVVDCTTTQWVCVTMMDGADFSINTTTGNVTDAAGDSADYPADGISDCRRIQAGGSVSIVVELDYFRTSGQTAGAVGRRINTCVDAAYVGRPCRVNADCPTGNCGTAGNFDDITQAFLAGHNDCAWNLQKHLGG